MGSSSKIAPEWGREGSVMAEIPPIVGGFLGVFPTQHLRVLGWVFSRRDGARHPDVRVFLSMTPPSGGVMDIRVIFRGGTGTPWKIIYESTTITEMIVTSCPRDGWQLVEYIYTGLPLKSQR